MNILVDSSVWIAYFNGRDCWQSEFLDRVLGWEPLIVGDLILAEVLQGFRSQKDFELARQALTRFPVVSLINDQIAIQSAINYRALRKAGFTVHKTIDSLIATYCLSSRTALLHDDRDFEPFAVHLNLMVINP